MIRDLLHGRGTTALLVTTLAMTLLACGNSDDTVEDAGPADASATHDSSVLADAAPDAAHDAAADAAPDAAPNDGGIDYACINLHTCCASITNADTQDDCENTAATEDVTVCQMALSMCRSANACP